MNALFAPGAKRYRLLIVVVLAILLASPVVMIWASRKEADLLSSTDSPVMVEILQRQARLHASAQLPVGHERPAMIAAFGDKFKTPKLANDPAGLMLTPLGHLRHDDPEALLKDIPTSLRFQPGELTKSDRGKVVDGLNLVMLEGKALAAHGLDAIQARLDGRVLSYSPENTLLVYVTGAQVAALGRNPDVKFIQPYEPGFKVATDTGRRTLIERDRANRPDLILEVFGVPGRDGAGLKKDLARVEGVKSVVDDGTDGSGFLVVAHFSAVSKIAHLKDVAYVKEQYEMMQLNGKNSPTVQMGSWEDSFNIRPFDLAGVDGGGIDTNADGQRINDGTDTVPPQIVGITDNGVSYDTPSFAQSATQPVDAGHQIGPNHRKIHSIQTITDSGGTCDGTLSGSGTHGTIVASAIAAYPTQVGFFLTTVGIGGTGAARNVNMDGVARGARIIMQDAADATRCTINSLIERGGNVSPGRLLTDLQKMICPSAGGAGLCAGVVGGGTEIHLAVLPFGAPDNFSTTRFPLSNGTYPQEAADLDTFIYNNRDFMIINPVGNSGGIASTTRTQSVTAELPDLFDGTANNDDPNLPHLIQVQPPATAKNIISVGSSEADSVTLFGTTDTEDANDNFSSRGPATAASLRTAPILMGPGSDLLVGTVVGEVAALRSRDNDNAGPVDAQLDSGNFGTSYSASYVTGAGAVVRDYFAQGFFPGGDRNATDRVANISGNLVKSALIASANFLEFVSTQGQDPAPSTEANLRRTRSMDLGTNFGTPVGVIGNSEQGYGRVVLTSVLPLSVWPKTFRVNPNTTIEHPAAGLLVWDDIATGEPLINNTTTQVQHTFRVSGQNVLHLAAGPMVMQQSELRIGLSWPDPPSAAGSGGTLVNDLDLVLEGPGPDNCLTAGETKYDGTICPAGAAADNQFFDGNLYNGGHNNVFTDQWSKRRLVGETELHDSRNPQEAIHLTADPNADDVFTDSQIYVGTWRVTVKRGAGGAVAGQISGAVAVSEDANNNRRLDAGEDANANGLLDLNGQAYALVVAGPVFLAEAAPLKGPASYPQSSATFSRVRYSCSDSAVLNLFDSTAGAGPARSQASTTFQVINTLGAVVDSESNITFAAGTVPGATSSVGVPVRLAGPPIPNDGILEADTGSLIGAVYAPAGQRAVSARSSVQCTPDFINAFFLIDGNNAIGDQFQIAGGCDNDEFLDAGETVTYGVALINRDRVNDYTDVTATLTPSGTGAGAVRVLDSPRSLGRLPGAGADGVFFHVFVDPTKIPAVVADRKVTMTLTLDASSKGQRLSRQSYSFTHAINADRQTFHYSTDFPAGGRQVRDVNRNLVIDKPDQVDPFRLFILPDEDITFSSLFVAGAAGGLVTNTLGEDLNNNGLLDAGEDIIPNGVLDKGIVALPGGPSAGDQIPWNFDQNSGGWQGFRHPQSTVPGANAWEYKTSGLCGFQTAAGVGKFGIWHAGDGNPATPSASASACDNYLVPQDLNTPVRAEFYMDVLHSPIIAKVNQLNDARGFNFTVEFQRFATNFNMQVLDAYAGGGVNIDNDIDNDSVNCLLCQQLDIYYTRRFGGWPYAMFKFAGQYFTDPDQGIDPKSYSPYQRTFGPFLNPNGSSQLDGDETGSTGRTQNTNPDSLSPIPSAKPDYLPFPLPGAPVPGVCTGGPTPGGPCQVNADCGAGGTCTLETKTVAGPVRNFESSLIGYEGGFSVPVNGLSSPETDMFFTPGKAGNRWEIGFSFFSIENSSGNGDYGISADDVVFEWDESHPQDEAAFSPAHQPACSRFGGPGQPAGGQCATVTVDRTNLYECDESVEITVFDPKKPADPSVQVMVVTDSDSVPFVTSRFSVQQPTTKRYTLNAVPGTNGLFKGNVTFSTAANNSTHVFTNAGTDAVFTVYYIDPLCDADGDGQAGEDLFDNIDGDGVALTVDNCPLIYNPTQTDTDLDGVGDLCDNCVVVPNANQADIDADGVGNACDFDDVDGDGVENATDNCPDLYNPDQTPAQGSSGRGLACAGNGDLDGDGIADRLDNCVLTANGGGANTNRDADGLGDACDGDCPGATASLICSNAPATSCTTNAQCPGGTCQTVVHHPIANVCSTLDDDADADSIEDSVDSCPAIYNPAIIPGTKRQLDSDRDGLGDACDPAGSLDDDNNGVPDDIAIFSGSINCKILPLAKFAVLEANYKDANGDQDFFPDPGEMGRLHVKLKNLGVALSGATFHLSSSDSDVACITSPTVFQGNIAANAEVDLSVFDPTLPINTATPGFFFTTSTALQSLPGQPPAKVELCLSVTANEVGGIDAPICFSLFGDLDVPPGAVQTFVNGPDGTPGTGDDGLLSEGFDVDRNNDGIISVNDTFLHAVDGSIDSGAHGYYIKGSDTGGGVNVVAAVACGGYTDLAGGNLGCRLNPNFPFEWHLHCTSLDPNNPPATRCPNAETGPCLGGCDPNYKTPTNGTKAISQPNSMHMGVHFVTSDATAGDTVHLRTLQAFSTPAINLALFPRAGDLLFSFYHIISLRSGGGFGVSGPPLSCFDCGDVQVRVDLDPDPAHDNWGFWDKLVPFENVYEHKPGAWSSFTPYAYYCTFTPTDTGAASPAPRGVHETLCYPQGAWSKCGSVRAQDPATTNFCNTPGVLDPSGTGVWVQTKFNLASFLGNRIQIRWIGETWDFDATTNDYFSLGGGWSPSSQDDGWWIDNVQVTGVITSQLTPVPDTKAPVGAVTCPTPATAGGCNNAVADRGTSVSIQVTDAQNAVIDGTTNLAVSGQPVRINAAASTIPGGCANGAMQLQFFKNGVLAQDWSSKNFFEDSPEVDASYSVKARCSSDFNCTSLTGAAANVQVYRGDSDEIALTVTHDRATGVTTLRWPARPQLAPLTGYDAFRGTVPPPDGSLGTLTTLSCNVPQAALGTDITLTTTASPSTGQAHYYLVGHSSPTAGARTSLGRASSGTVLIAPISCP